MRSTKKRAQTIRASRFQRLRAGIEHLESRWNPSTLTLYGTDTADQMTLRVDDLDTLHYTLNGVEATFANQSLYSQITLDALAGDDTVQAIGSFAPLEIYGGYGSDRIDAPGTIHGGAGDDLITLQNQTDSTRPNYNGVADGDSGNDTFIRPVTGNATIDGGSGTNLIVAPLPEGFTDYTVNTRITQTAGFSAYQVSDTDRSTQLVTDYQPDHYAQINKVIFKTNNNNLVKFVVGDEGAFSFAVDASADLSYYSFVQISGVADQPDELYLYPSTTPGKTWGTISSGTDENWNADLELIGVRDVVFHGGGGVAKDTLILQGTRAADQFAMSSMDAESVAISDTAVASVLFSHMGTNADGTPASTVALNGDGGADTFQLNILKTANFNLASVKVNETPLAGTDPATVLNTVTFGTSLPNSQVNYTPLSAYSGEIGISGGATRYIIAAASQLNFQGNGGNDHLTVVGSGAFDVATGTLPGSGRVALGGNLPIAFQGLGDGGSVNIQSEGAKDSLTVRGTSVDQRFATNSTSVQVGQYLNIVHNLKADERLALVGGGGSDGLDLTSDATAAGPVLTLGQDEFVTGIGPRIDLFGISDMTMRTEPGSAAFFNIAQFGATAAIRTIGVYGSQVDGLGVSAAAGSQTTIFNPASEARTSSVSTSAGPVVLKYANFEQITITPSGTQGTLELMGTVGDDFIQNGAAAGEIQINETTVKVAPGWGLLKLSTLQGNDKVADDEHPLNDLGANLLVVDLGAGNDYFNGGNLSPEGGLTVYGGEGDENIFMLGKTDNTAFGGPGTDYIQGNGRINTIYGEAGNDYLISSFSFVDGMASSLYGGDDNDYLTMNVMGNTDVIDGGNGAQDELFVYSKTDVTVTPNGNRLKIYSKAEIASNYAGNVEWIQVVMKEPLQKSIYINDLSNTGVNYVQAIFMDDPYDPKPGPWGGNNLIIQGSPGNDSIFVTPDDNSVSFSNDIVAVTMPWGTIAYGMKDTPASNPDTITIKAGFGNDRIEVDPTTDLSTVRLNIQGQGDDDTIKGSAWPDLLAGGDGNDVLFGLDGNDSITGGTGDDLLDGGVGNDQIWGEDCNDTLIGGMGDDALYGGNGEDIIYGGFVPQAPTKNLLKKKQKPKVNDGNDTLAGGDGFDQLDGGTGQNTMDAGFDGIHEVMKGSGTFNTGYVHVVNGKHEDWLSVKTPKKVIAQGVIPTPKPPGTV